ncbi:hypothetical protein OO010_15755, partial [Flavobacteriaceae bacterium KMM 6898]|nr:hypothetical protein [Flavobacteriaceae bacterium KMM 6898]
LTLNGTDFDVDNLAGEVTGPTTATVIANDAVTSAKIANGTIAAVDLNQMGAANDQILKWNGTVWAPAADAGGTFNLATDNLTQDAGEDRTYNLNSQNLSFVGTGLVGIGTGSPTNKLHVSGAIRAEGGFRSTFGTLPSSVAYSFDNDSDTGMYRPAVNQLGLVTNELEAIRIDASQNIGIGLTGPLEKLHVNGNIRADGDFISNGIVLTVPDYVFEKYFLGSSNLKKDYNFQTLAQIGAFVKEFHHLPGIKSAEEVKKDGFWNLSESNLQNLEKIEELFLHTIEQEKKIQELRSKNETMSIELKSLRKDLEEIKALLKKQ